MEAHPEPTFRPDLLDPENQPKTVSEFEAWCREAYNRLREVIEFADSAPGELDEQHSRDGHARPGTFDEQHFRHEHSFPPELDEQHFRDAAEFVAQARIISVTLGAANLLEVCPRRTAMTPDRAIVCIWKCLEWCRQNGSRLHERGRFEQPESAKEMLRELEELSSPIKAFVNDRCVLGVFRNVKREELYAAYQKWCEETGRKYPDAPNTFGRNLRAAFPQIGDTQPVINGERVRFYDGIALK